MCDVMERAVNKGKEEVRKEERISFLQSKSYFNLSETDIQNLHSIRQEYVYKYVV